MFLVPEGLKLMPSCFEREFMGELVLVMTRGLAMSLDLPPEAGLLASVEFSGVVPSVEMYFSKFFW